MNNFINSPQETATLLGLMKLSVVLKSKDKLECIFFVIPFLKKTLGVIIKHSVHLSANPHSLESQK